MASTTMGMPAAAPDAHLAPTGHAGVIRNNLPELSPSQSTLDAPTPAPVPALRSRKSMRMRPAQPSDHPQQQRLQAPQQQQQHNVAASAPPLKPPTTPQPPELRPRASKMSLFNLFSKPKVERQRGYAESGLDVLPSTRARTINDVPSPQPDTVLHLQQTTVANGRTPPASSKSSSTRKPKMYTSAEPLPPLISDRRVRHFDPPPLFQVWPQTSKSGSLEVMTTSSDATMQIQKPKTRLSDAFLAPTNDILGHAAGYRGSVESKLTISSRNGSISGLGLPKKIVILTTSGHLLQYSDTGPSDRIPEKVLQLGKDSAAFASDLIPGKHHVLQVSQAVNPDGVSVGTTQSLFSRFSMRRQAPSRATSTFLLVMSGPEEMKVWMSAIRKEIEIQGGKRARSDSTTSRPITAQPLKVDMQKTPSVSHRYQVKRDPGGPSPLTSPKLGAFPSSPQPSPRLETQFTSLPGTPGMVIEKPAPDTSEDVIASLLKLPQTPEAAPETETEAHKTDTESIKARPRAASDAHSIDSSTALSVEQQQLERLRSSVRMSHTSTVATSVTAASRTNSMTSSPSDQSKDTAEGARDSALFKLPYRALSSHPLTKRRSAVPLSLKEVPLAEGIEFKTLMQQQRLALMDSTMDSSLLGFSPPISEPSPSPRNYRLSSAQSTPNLKSHVEIAAKHDSKLPFPQLQERPESFLADLPDPTTWASKPSPNLRMSTSVPFPPLVDTPVSKGHDRNGSSTTKTSPTSRPLRSGSNSFSLPLRVNPPDASSVRTPPSVRSPKRSISDGDEEKVLSPIAAVHTLTAKVDVATRTTIDASFIPTRKSSTSGSPPNMSVRAPSAKLSLFPSAQPAPPPVFPNMDPLRRSPSATVLSSYAQAPVQAHHATANRLSRPASLQVRTDHAPFLSSIRSTSATSPNVRLSTSMAPIRSLKPSRSVATMQTPKSSSGCPPASRAMNFSIRSLQSEAADQAMPLASIARPISPAVGPMSRPPSSIKRISRMSSHGVDLSNLGPPSAPPPSTPLPEIPPPSMDKNPERSLHDRLSFIRAGTPIGLAIGEALDEAAERRGSVMQFAGLGIAVTETKEPIATT